MRTYYEVDLNKVDTAPFIYLQPTVVRVDVTVNKKGNEEFKRSIVVMFGQTVPREEAQAKAELIKNLLNEQWTKILENGSLRTETKQDVTS
jgi:hypothetical protein